MIVLAATHPAEVRLAVALAGLIGFLALATTRGRKSVPAGSVLVLGLIVVGWLFGATLVWGTGYASKVRWSAGWTHNGNAWQWTGLLVLALAGVLPLALSLRSLVQAKQRLSWVFAAVSGALFVAWSAVVRYPAVVAVIAVGAGFGSLLFATARQPTGTPRRAREQYVNG